MDVLDCLPGILARMIWMVLFGIGFGVAVPGSAFSWTAFWTCIGIGFVISVVSRDDDDTW